MLLPGTFLGVWNLIAISGSRAGAGVPDGWIQAHGHAQIFGWIGSFILGVGFYSLSKMGQGASGAGAAGAGATGAAGVGASRAAMRAGVSWWLWVLGVSLRWFGNIYEWHWRVLLPLSGALELAAFCIFFDTVRRHRPEPHPGAHGSGLPLWIGLVIASTMGFFASLVANLGAAIWISAYGATPAIPHVAGQRMLALFTWGFIVPAIWGFNSRWLPAFAGLRESRGWMLIGALAANTAGVAAALFGAARAFGALASLASLACVLGLRIYEEPARPPSLDGAHASFPVFIRLAYVWLLAAAGLSLWAAGFDRAGGIWGASRHALTVGFVSTMTFAIGQRILPPFAGMRRLFSPKLMFASLAILNAGCLLRVAGEIPAYESYAPGVWPVLPVSAVLEMTAFTLFAANLLLTFFTPRVMLSRAGGPKMEPGESL